MKDIDLLDGIRSWVEIESQTADVPGVERALQKAELDFTSAGADVRSIPAAPGCARHLLAATPGFADAAVDAPGILVLCHLDTVHPKGTLGSDLPFRIDGDRAYGPGIYDMKGGAYLAFAAFRAVTARSSTAGAHVTPLPIRLLYTSDEEIGSPTSRAHIEREAARAKYVLVMEPGRDGGKVVTARKGVGRYTLAAHGRPAHAGARHADGRNAILEIARQIVGIEGMTDYERGITLNVGQVRGGTADNVVPAHCACAIDLRVETLADAAAMHERLMALRPFNADVRLVLEGQLNRPPYEKNTGVSALYAHARTLALELGFDIPDTATGGGSDGNFTAHLAPTLDGLGVDGAGAHTHEEHLLMSSLVPRMHLMRRLFETLS